MTTTAPARDLSRGWLVAGVEYAFAAWYAVCAYLALARAKDFAGHWCLPARDDVYTEKAIVYGGWAMAYPVTLTITSAAVLAALGLIVNGGMFAVGYPRGSRALTVSLIGSSVALLLVLIVSLTPPALAVSGWLLD